MTDPKFKAGDLNQAVTAHADCGHKAEWLWFCSVCMNEKIAKAEILGQVKQWGKEICEDTEHHEKIEKLSYQHGLRRAAEIAEIARVEIEGVDIELKVLGLKIPDFFVRGVNITERFVEAMHAGFKVLAIAIREEIKK